MPSYKVAIEGRNFLIDMDGRVAKHGFLTWRYVEAVDPAAAENASVELLRQDDRLRPVVLNAAHDSPVMDVTEIAEVDPSEHLGRPQPGFIWYAERPRRWWKFWRR